MASSEQKIRIKNIPECVMGLDGTRPLRDVLTDIEIATTDGSADGFLSKDEFVAAKNNGKRFAGFRRFRDFAQFKKYIFSYVASWMCDESCRESEVMTDEAVEICIAPPRPELPPFPKKRKKPPDISDFSSNVPDWFDRPPPNKGRSPRPRVVASIEDKVMAGFKSGVEVFDDELPDIEDMSEPVIRARFDGDYFILDFHGCYVNSDQVCVADWSYFVANVQNIASTTFVHREADSRGLVRVKVEARIGDIVVVSGTDLFNGQPSLNRLSYIINDDSLVEFIGMTRSDGSNSEVARTLNHLANKRQTASGGDLALDVVDKLTLGLFKSLIVNPISYLIDPTARAAHGIRLKQMRDANARDLETVERYELEDMDDGPKDILDVFQLVD